MNERHTVVMLDEEWWGTVAGEAEIKPALPVVSPSSIIYPVSIRAEVKAGQHEAELLDTGGRVRYNGTEYPSPSTAGQVASGWKSCNGWTFWRYQHPDTGEWRTISDLRLTNKK